MANKIAAAALQYSKWLSRFICWVWAFYRLLAVCLAAISPEAAEPIVSTIAGLDTIMLVNEGTYLVNSLGEKVLYSDRFILKWLDKQGFKSLVAKAAARLTKEGDEDGDDQNG